MNCPNCKQDITLEKENLKLHKQGRYADCPKCGKGIILTKRYKGSKNPKEHMSKKERLRRRSR